MRYKISVHNKTQIKLSFFADYGVLERHIQVDTILGSLEMEKEAFQQAQIFSWIFFPLWIIMAIVQAVCFVLSNGRFHPLAKILEDCDASDEGKYFLIVKL